VNLLLLAIAFRAWSGSALSAYLRIMAAVAAFSLEVQLATWFHAGNLRSIRLLNLAGAVAGVLWHSYRRSTAGRADLQEQPPRSRDATIAAARLPPFIAIAALALTSGLLASSRPVMGADPYHLHRVDQITSLGTLAYDPAALDIKINALAGVYELLLADLRIPGMSTALVRFHGVFGLGLYLLVIAVVNTWIGVRRRWLLIALLVVPVVFHQLVLVKNDLFGALPAVVALVWVVTRGPDMSARETATAAALAGFAVGIKISSAPVALVIGGFVVLDHRRDWRLVAPTLAAGIAGAFAGGLLFTLVENELVYGGALQPYMSLGNRYEHATDAVTGLGRFAISLLDLGTVSPRLWPGRGGWGSTFGLPMIWALMVLALHWREVQVRRALVAAGVCFVGFAASYPDADIAHRMVIGPGLLLVAIALGCVDRDERRRPALRIALIPVLALSALQIGRSTAAYLTGG
jgi:hypothetical protein